MTGPEIALVLFTACNSVRVLAYVPQIAAVVRDRNGASAISCTTWGMFAVSHFSTVVYAHLVLLDLRMAAIFAANTVCCVLIVGLTAHKRGLLGATVRPELRGRLGIVVLSAVFVSGVALAFTLGSPSEKAPQPPPTFVVNGTPQLTDGEAAAQKPEAPRPAEASLDHYARLSQSHELYWETKHDARWPFTLNGTWDVPTSAWRTFELEHAATTTALPSLTLPLGKVQQRGTVRSRLEQPRVSRPKSRQASTSTARR